MSSDSDLVLEWERRQAAAVLRSVRGRLRRARRKRYAELVACAWEWAEPALVAGRHINPVHHTSHVVDFMVRIMLRELQRPQPRQARMPVRQRDLALGIVAAVFHDAANAFEPKQEMRIRAKDVRADPSLRAAAVQQRARHMQNGGVLVEAVLRAAPQGEFSAREIATVRKLVEHHDDPTIAELLGDAAARKDYLFVPEAGHRLGDIYPLSAILREADRLWMLTIPGIVCDLKRNAARGKPWDPPAQIKGNVKRHKEERGLYETHWADQLARWGFEEGAAFYRTAVGKRSFRQLPAAAGKLDNAAWIRRVADSWFIDPGSGGRNTNVER